MELKGLNCQNLSDFKRELSPEEKNELIKKIHSEWALTKNDSILLRDFKFKNFKSAFEFVTQISDIAEKNRHHPDIHFGWAYCRLEITTHSLNNLALNDFILAFQVDEIFLNF